MGDVWEVGCGDLSGNARQATEITWVIILQYVNVGYVVSICTFALESANVEG